MWKQGSLQALSFITVGDFNGLITHLDFRFSLCLGDWDSSVFQSEGLRQPRSLILFPLPNLSSLLNDKGGKREPGIEVGSERHQPIQAR